MTCTASDLTIVRGDTFTHVVRWGTTPVVYKAITAATKAAPCVLTVPTHGVPNGWPIAISNVNGMTQLNAEHEPPWPSEYHPATVTDGSTIELNDVNSLSFTTYGSGGIIRYDTPVTLTGYTARMSVKDRVGGTEILSLTTVNSRIVLDDTDQTITLTVDATDTDALIVGDYVYDLEMTSGAGVVTTIARGSFTIAEEITE